MNRHLERSSWVSSWRILAPALGMAGDDQIEEIGKILPQAR